MDATFYIFGSLIINVVFFYLEVSLLLTFLVACVNMVVVDSRFKKNVQFIIESLFIF